MVWVGVGRDHIRLSMISGAMSHHWGVVRGSVDSVSHMAKSMAQQRSRVNSVTQVTNAMTQGGNTVVTKQTSRGGTRSGDQGWDGGKDLIYEWSLNLSEKVFLIGQFIWVKWNKIILEFYSPSYYDYCCSRCGNRLMLWAHFRDHFIVTTLIFVRLF